MAKKNVRELKVCAQSGYRYKDVPSIRLMGQWLEASGLIAELKADIVVLTKVTFANH